MSGFFSSVKRWILWSYPRGSVQYDVMVALILAFIFLTPRELFHDYPKPKEVVMLPGEGGAAVFWLEPELLEGYAGEARASRAEQLIRKQARSGRYALDRLEPIFDSEKEIRGYMAFASPRN